MTTRTSDSSSPQRDADRHLRIILESAKDFAIMSFDLSGSVVIWNAGAENLFGYRAEDIVGKDFGLLFTEEDRAEGIPENELKVALKEGSAINDRWQRRQDGTHFYASGMVRPLLNEQEQAVGFIKILRDLTIHRLLEQERAAALVQEQKAYAQLEQANRLIMQFVAVVSHELRNPLTAIKGSVSSLLSRDVRFTPEEQREFLEIISAETERLAELTSQLLDYTQLETGRLGLTPIRTTFDAVLKAINPQLHMLAPDHMLVINPPQPSPDLEIDISRIGQVMINLVGNAVRYCPVETTITVSGQVQDGFLRIDVIDEGPGIPPDKREQIFEAFVQIGIDRDRETKGAGLGLSIAKGIVERHGGRIWIEDRQERGTVVSFTLPLAAD